MRVCELSPSELRQRLSDPGLRLQTGPVITNIVSPLVEVHEGIRLHYANHRVEAADGFADFHVRVEASTGIRRWWKPQVIFRIDGAAPFNALPRAQAFPMLEWGLNWCVSSHCHQFIIVHAAVVSRGNLAVLMPAPSGTGKSTLCAGLALAGWRLMSDELALIDARTGELSALARPVSLKNASIEVVRAWAPHAEFGPVVADTIKGSVAHVKPTEASAVAADERARARWVVLPAFDPSAIPSLEPLSRGQAFMQLVDNAFNYDVHGADGFRVLADLVEGCDCFQLRYARMDDAVAILNELAATA